ncbi:acetoin dehydrogenase E1 component beta-subunit [Mycetohabitans endofungorum]|uniref:acetoin dehydrogenase E1 component beta-subunit n=1 Tax=Mycetohabitans endofungorum TaxID=417203 RepID=UPI002B056668|nr:acetoin dehydrogenase E1 component beta-subunit [Mycetohabitans endofungorum]
MVIAVALSMNACGGGGGEPGVGDAMVAGQPDTRTATALHTSALSERPTSVSSEKPASGLFGEAVTSYFQMQVSDETLDLAATVGMVPIEGASDDDRIVYVAYTQRDVEPSSRPVTFLFGDSIRHDPLRSTGYLLLATVGPIVGNLSGRECWDRYDNVSTLLDVSDLIFVHPTGSGLGDFWGSPHAGRTAMRFIDNYLDAYQRRGSPVYLVTHGARVAGHAMDLLKTRPHGFAGMAILSPVLGPDRRAEHREPPAKISWELGAQWLLHLDADLGLDVKRHLPAELDRLWQSPYDVAGDIRRCANDLFCAQSSEAPPWSAGALVDALSVADAPRLFIAYGSDVQEKAFSSELSRLNVHPALANRIQVESYRGFPEGDSRRDLFYLDEVARLLLRGGLQWLYASHDDASVGGLSHKEEPSRMIARSDALWQERDSSLELDMMGDTMRDSLVDSVPMQEQTGISTPRQLDRSWLDQLSNPFREGLSEDECLERACQLTSALLQEAENCLRTGPTSQPRRRQSIDSVFAQDDGASHLPRTSVSETTVSGHGDVRRRGSRLTPIRVEPELTEPRWPDLPTPPASPEK